MSGTTGEVPKCNAPRSRAGAAVGALGLVRDWITEALNILKTLKGSGGMKWGFWMRFWALRKMTRSMPLLVPSSIRVAR